MDTSDLPVEVTSLGLLIGLLSQSGDQLDVNAGWFSDPIAGLEGAETRLNNLAALIAQVLAPGVDSPPDVFPDARWFPIPNPKNGGGTVFHLVVPKGTDTRGQLGLGVLYPINIGDLTVEAYAYQPVFAYDSRGAQFAADNADYPCQIGLYATSSAGFQVGGVSFSALNLGAKIYLSGAPPTFGLTFENLEGAGGQPGTYNSLQDLLNSTAALGWIGEVIVQGSYWLNLYVGSSAVTVGEVLTQAQFLTQDAQGKYHLSLANLKDLPPAQIALNFVFAILGALANLDLALIPLPGGGIYVAEQQGAGGAADYGLRMVLDLPLTGSSGGGGGAPSTEVDLRLGAWLTGETAADNWMKRAGGAAPTYAPGLSVLLLRRAADNTLSFAPSFLLTSVGLDLKGGARTPLVNVGGYTLRGTDLRLYLNPEQSLSDPARWQYGFAIRLDDVGFPLAAKFGGGGASGNPVAENLLSSGASNGGNGGQGAGADNTPVNPPFSAAIAWRSDSTNSPKFNFQLFGPDENPADRVWIPIQRAFGPLHCQRLGIAWPQPNDDLRLSFLFDGDVSLAGLGVSLEGLSVGIPLGSPGDLGKYQLGLDGLAITFSEGPIEISGGLLKTHVAADGRDVLEYNGEALIKAASWSLTALGSWATLDGRPSLFIFAFLDAPIGGPAFFFVTGLSAGFGYNRSLLLPAPDQVQNFPLVAGLTDPSKIGGAGAGPAQALQALQNYVPPAQGVYWVAAGVQFTSFELINSNALVVVEFGKHFEIAVLGLSRVRLPQVGPVAYAYVELALEVIFDPGGGVFQATAVITDNSFVIDPACHLTGGFAFYVWFGGNQHAGDFVLTIGGYHPNFNKPEWYPDEPRLGFNWQVSDQLTIKGGAYFALTPSCVMGGGALDMQFHSGDLAAWFTAYADFLIQWKPFYYAVRIGVDIGVSYRINLLFTTKTIRVELGADLSVWGPPTGGVVHVHLWVISFAVSFGPDYGQGNAYLGFDDFRTLLPQDTPAQAKSPRAAADRMPFAEAGAAAPASDPPPAVPLSNVIKLTANRGQSPQATADGRWLVRSDEFAFTVETAFPLTELDLAGPNNTTTPLSPPPLPEKDPNAPACARPSDGYYVGVRPMGIDCADSVLKLTVADEHGKALDLQGGWLWVALTRAVPEALWGLAVPRTQTPPPSANTLPGRLVGLTNISPRIFEPSGPDAIPLANLSYDPINPQDQDYLPFPQTPVANQPQVSPTSLLTIADTINRDGAPDSPVAKRQAIFGALASFGYDAGANDDLSALAGAVNLNYSAAPMLGSPAA